MTHILVARCFNACFAQSHHTVLVGGGLEPLFVPAPAPHRSIIRYREDHVSSALHEAAHWCIAGKRRRQLFDYGYWYAPPPRSAAQREAFFAVELPVQALECLFSRTIGVPFSVSVDDVGAHDVAAEDRFASAVRTRAQAFVTDGLPARAKQFCNALAHHAC